MQRAFFDAYLEVLGALHADLAAALEGLPPEALDWVPGPGTNSLTVLFVHTLGSERFWIGDMAGQEPSGRVRSAEFQARGLDPQDLRRRLDEVLAHSQGVLGRLTLEELGHERRSPLQDRARSVAWCLVHNLEHVATHLGHIQLTRQWWEQRARG